MPFYTRPGSMMNTDAFEDVSFREAQAAKGQIANDPFPQNLPGRPIRQLRAKPPTLIGRLFKTTICRVIIAILLVVWVAVAAGLPATITTTPPMVTVEATTTASVIASAYTTMVTVVATRGIEIVAPTVVEVTATPSPTHQVAMKNFNDFNSDVN